MLSKKEQEQIYRNFIIKKFKTEIENHKNKNCNCDLAKNKFCDIGKWLEGCMSSQELLKKYDYIIAHILDIEIEIENNIVIIKKKNNFKKENI